VPAISQLLSDGQLEGVVITDEDLADEWMPDRSELEEMDDNAAAMLAGHLFSRLTGVKADNQSCDEYDHEEQIWSGLVNEYSWTIEQDGDDYLITIEE
jgi:hypothetical protein